jgi:hypothetical protein
MPLFFKNNFYFPLISVCVKYTSQIIIALILINLLSFNAAFAQGAKNQADLKKEASANFIKRNYEKAYQIFSLLLSIYPKDPEYNFKYGACLLFTDQDKEKALKFLQFAVSIETVDPEAYYFYAKALHLNYKFDQAIEYYKKFIAKGSKKSKAEFKPEREIESCKNGKQLIRNINNIHVMDKKDVRADDFFRFYDLGEFGGKIIVRPEDFMTPFDKKKGERSIMFQPNQAKELYFASYGENDLNGKDIYFVKKLPNGEWSQPQSLGAPINTPFDEDYPFLHPDGNILYFSSKGHNSMGGYDIFKSVRDPKTGQWGQPENLDFAINSPDDDILFITNKDQSIACFSSSRASKIGYTTIYKIDIEARPEEFLLVSGKIISEHSSFLQTGVNIKLEDAEDNSLLGNYPASASDGKYLMKVPNGGRVKITVEVKDHSPRSEIVEIPFYGDKRMLKQEISLLGKGANYTVIFKNMFDQTSSEEDMLLALDIVKQQANLDVNYSESRAARFKRNYTQPDVVGPTGSGLHNKITTSASPSGKITNDQIVNIAKEDASVLNREAEELQNEAAFAFSFAAAKAEEAEKKHNAYKSTKDALDKITDPSQKKSETVRVNQLSREADRAAKDASIAFNLAERLETKARKKKQEAEQANKYVKDLENAVNSSSVDALKKLETQREQLIKSSSDKGSDEVVNDFKKKYQDKQKEAGKARAFADESLDEVKNFTADIANLEKEAAATKDKNKKQDINDRITSLQAEREDAIANQNKLSAKANQLEYEANQLKNDLDVIQNLQNEFALNDNREITSLDASQKSQLKTKISNIKTKTESSAGNETAFAASSQGKSTNTESSVTKSETGSAKSKDSDSPPAKQEVSSSDASEVISNYAKEYQQKLQQTDVITDPTEKLIKKSEITDAWATALEKEAAQRKNRLSSLNKQQQAEEQKKIEAFEKEAREKRSQSIDFADRALSDDNKEIKPAKQEVSSLEASEIISNYAKEYQQKLQQTDLITDPTERLIKRSEITEAWATALEKEAAQRKNRLSPLSKQEQTEEQKKIDALEKEAREKRAQSIDLADRALSDNSKEKATSDVKLKKEEIDILNENDEIINYASVYNQKLQQADRLKDTKEQLRKKSEILDAWASSLQKEVVHRKSKLNSLSKQLQAEEKKKIDALEKEARDKNTESAALAARAESMGSLASTDKKSSRAEEIEIFKSNGEIIDYNSTYEQKAKQAEGIKDIKDQSIKLSEIADAWSSSLTKEADHKESNLYLLEKSAQPDQQRQIDQLRRLSEEKESEAAAHLLRATAISGNTSLAPQTNLTKEEVNIFNEKGELKDYSADYEKKIKQAEQIKNENEQLLKKSEINEAWVASLEKDIAYRRSNIKKLNPAQHAEEQKKIKELSEILRQKKRQRDAMYAKVAAIEKNPVLASYKSTLVNEEEINIFNEKGEVINYQVAYQEKIIQAEKIKNEREKLLKNSALTEAWSASIEKEAGHRRLNLEKLSKSAKAEELNKISALEAQAKQKRREAEALYSKAIAVPGAMTITQNKAGFVNEEINIFNESGVLRDYNSEYNNKLSAAESIRSQSEAKLKKSEILNAWTASIEKDAAYRQKNLSGLNKNSQEEEKKRIEALEKEALAKNAEAERIFLEALISPDDKVLADKTVKQETQLNSEATKKHFEGVADFVEVVEVINDKGEFVNYQEKYQAQLSKAEPIANDFQRERTKGEILSNWSASVNKETSIRKQNLSKLKGKTRKDEEKKIAELTELAVNKQIEADKHLKKAESLRSIEKTVADRSLAIEKDDTDRSFNAFENDPALSSGTASYTASRPYTAEEANSKFQEATSLRKEALQLKIEANQLRSEASSKTSEEEKKQALSKANEKDAEALNKQIIAATYASEANNIELAANNKTIERALKSAPGSKKTDAAEMLYDESVYIQAQALKQRSISDSQTESAMSKLNALERALEFESQAISKQRESLILFDEISVSEPDQPATASKSSSQDVSLESKSQASVKDISSESSLSSSANDEELKNKIADLNTRAKENRVRAQNYTAEAKKEENASAELSSKAAATKKKKEKDELENQANAKNQKAKELLSEAEKANNQAEKYEAESASLSAQLSSSATASGISSNQRKGSSDDYLVDQIASGNTNASGTKNSEQIQSFQQVNSESASSKKEAENARLIASEIQKEADELDRFAQDLASDAAKESDPVRKQQLLNESNELKLLADEKKTEAAQANKIANNYLSESSSKQTESDQFLNEFDKENYEGSTSAQKSTAGVASTPPASKASAASARFEPPKVLNSEIFEKTSAQIYSSNNPIPVDLPLPEGLVFKVQIGAFRNPIPQDLFQGFSPITGETTPQGLTRYTAGYFKSFKTADLAKEVIRENGYRDAFVVAFYNGRRISINEANALIREGKVPVPAASERTDMFSQNTQNAERQQANSNTSVQPYMGVNPANFPPDVAPYKELESVKGLFYTVQVGVYTKQVPATQLFNIQPLNVEKTPNGLLRYSSGIFNNIARANEAKNSIVNIGIKDAFVTAYYDGKRISVAEAKAMEASGGSSVFVNGQGVNQLPYTSSGATVSQGVATIQPNPSLPAVQPNNTARETVTESKPNVITSPTAKATPGDLNYKVQIGAFRDEVPVEIATIFFQITKKGITHYKNEEGLTIYNAGNFTTYDEALRLKNELSQDYNLKDSFVVPYLKGKRIPLNEALEMK